MSESVDNRNVRNDEIDLLDLFNRMGRTVSRWAKLLGTGILITIVFIVRRWLPLFLSILIGIAVSYFMKTTSTPTYASDIVLKSNTVHSSEIIPYFNTIHSYSVAGNSNTLAQALSIDHETAKNISDISCYWLMDMNTDSIPDYVNYEGGSTVTDTANYKKRMQDRFDIRIKIKKPEDLTIVRNGLISYLEKDSLLQQINRVRLNQNQQLLARLDYDILQLDSLQKVKYFEETRTRQPQGGGQMIFMQAQNTQLVYTDIYSLYKKKLALETEQALYKGIVTVLSDFSLPSQGDYSTKYYGKLIIPLFFGITLLILLLLANRKNLGDIYKKYK